MCVCFGCGYSLVSGGSVQLNPVIKIVEDEELWEAMSERLNQQPVMPVADNCIKYSLLWLIIFVFQSLDRFSINMWFS